MRVKMKKLFNDFKSYENQEITVMAWIRTNRPQAKFGFLSLNDGSYFENVQVIYDSELINFEEISKYRVGASVKVLGKVVLTPEMKQPFEIHAISVDLLGDSPENYPIQPKRHTREFLREVNVGLPVTRLAKWKTGFQMTALSMLFFDGWFIWGGLGELLLWIAGGLTFYTGYQYFAKSLEYIKQEEAKKDNSVKSKETTNKVVSKKTPAKKSNKAKI